MVSFKCQPFGYLNTTLCGLHLHLLFELSFSESCSILLKNVAIKDSYQKIASKWIAMSPAGEKKEKNNVQVYES